MNNISHASGHSRSRSVTSEGGTSRMSATAEGLALTQEERMYLLYVQRGDVASVKRLLDNERPPGYILDIDCTDPIGRSAITIAIENENIDLLEALLERGVQPKDALLQAIAEEYVEGVELLLRWEEKQHIPGELYSWEKTENDTAAYTKDITPLILAAHRNHYEILKLLLDRGASLPMPHDIRCGCDACIASTKEDSLRHSLSRINAYKALASPSLISLSSKDPILTAFELSAELSRLESMEHEFKSEYIKLQEIVQEFCTRLLDQVSTHKELWTLLNYSASSEDDSDGGGGAANHEGDVCSLSRLKLAIKFSQKSFVAHSNVQQFLGNIWYNDLPGFRRLPMLSQLMTVLRLACSFPILSMAYIVKPESPRGMFAKKPFVKFISHCASYMFFLSLLTLASQRFEYLLIEMFGNDWLLSVLKGWRERERGSLPGPTELVIMSYVFGLVWAEVKALWTDGLLEYLHDLMNIVDFVTNSFFLAWVQLRATAWILVRRDLWWSDVSPWYPREQWHAFDPMLLSEGCFGAAMIISFLKLVNIFSVNHHLGPLQISLGRMIFDILKFFFLYMLVLFAFGCGLIQMLWYYADLEMHQCYHLPGGLPDYDKRESSCINWRRFANLFESSQSLFWASFGLVELDAFDLTGLGSFTRFWGLLMFGSYSLINIIVLLNLLIAMMSNSYQAISERADTEWKFARTKLWISYFEDGGTVPAPFNLIPTPKGIMQLLGKGQHQIRGSMKDKNKRKVEQQHQDVMRLLVRRYITEQQRQADERKVTEDDVNEIKQDVSTFRFQLIDILRNNGMNTSIASTDDPTVIGRKGRAMERKLMKGFNIGRVEGIVNEVLTESKKGSSIFGKLAQAIGSKRKSVKTDWNAKVHRASMRRDQIGSSSTSLSRSQASLRRRIQFENEQLLQTMNPSSITEYNPNVEQLSDQTKIAYAKFKMTTLQVEKIKQQKMKKLSESSSISTDGNTQSSKTKEVGETTPNATKTTAIISYENETKSKGSSQDSGQGKISVHSSKKEPKIDSQKETSELTSQASTSVTAAPPKLSPPKEKSDTSLGKKSPEDSTAASSQSAGTTPKIPKSSLAKSSPAEGQGSSKAPQSKSKPTKTPEKSTSGQPPQSSSSDGSPKRSTFSATGKSQLTGEKRTGWI